MAETSKLDQLKALRERKLAGNRSDGGGESRPASVPSATLRSDPSVLTEVGPKAGVAPGPSEAKRGRPRIGEKRDKPWIAAGLTERTWYRRKAEARART